MLNVCIQYYYSGFPFHRTLANPPMLLELNMPGESEFTDDTTLIVTFIISNYSFFLSYISVFIEATIYVKGRKVFMLCTDPKTDILKKIVPDFQEIEDKLAFIKNFVNLCVQSSRPPVSRRNVVASPEEDGAPRYDLGDSIATRIVAVVKKIDNTGEHDHVVMQTLLLNTLGLQGYLQLALDGQ